MKKLIVFLFAVMLSIASFAQLGIPNITGEGIECGSSGSGYSGSTYVTYSSVSGATYYQMYTPLTRNFTKTGSNCSSGVATVNGYVAMGKDYGTADIRVRACNGGGCGGWSSVGTAQLSVDPEYTLSYPGGPSSCDVDETITIQTNDADGAAFGYEWDITGGSYTIISGEESNVLRIQLHDEDEEYDFKVAAWRWCSGPAQTTYKGPHSVYVFD